MSTEIQYTCPQCERPLMSRRHKHCQYCGAEIPESLLYTKAEMEAQKEAQNREWEKSEVERKAREKEQDEEERKKRQQQGDAAAGTIEIMW